MTRNVTRPLPLLVLSGSGRCRIRNATPGVGCNWVVGNYASHSLDYAEIRGRVRRQGIIAVGTEFKIRRACVSRERIVFVLFRRVILSTAVLHYIQVVIILTLGCVSFFAAR